MFVNTHRNYFNLEIYFFFRQVVVLDPYLIEVGTKEMEESALKLQRKTLTSSERHSALLQYYSESSHAKRKAIWYLFSILRLCLFNTISAKFIYF